jgi:membrane-associated phospholipid phosphatase
MRHPLLSLERVARLTKQLLVVETAAVAVPGFEHHSFAEFFGTNELNGDVSNWWTPNRHAAIAMCKAAGFSRVEARQDPADRPTERDTLHRYRLVLRAWK